MNKLAKQEFIPPKRGELMVEMLFDCIIFLTVTYVPAYIG